MSELSAIAATTQDCSTDPSTYEAEVEALHAPALARARRSILVVGLLYALFGAVVGFALHMQGKTDDGIAVALVNLCFMVMQLGFWGWARSEPLQATATALLFYLGAQVIEVMVDPSTIVAGLAIKVVFIAFLAHGVRAGLLARRMQRLMSSKS